MRLIAIDTATAEPGLCLRDGPNVAGAWRGPPRCGPGAVLAAAGNLLAEAGMDFATLDAIAFGRGPGGFTGVRLGVALAQGLSLGAGPALVPVSDLAALAWNANRQRGWERVLACLDARQGELYWAAYVYDGAEGLRLSGEECLGPPHAFAVPPGEWAFAGSGVPLLASRVLAGESDPGLAPDAGAVAELGMQALARGETVALEAAMPHYLRNRVAQPSQRYRRLRDTLA